MTDLLKRLRVVLAPVLVLGVLGALTVVVPPTGATAATSPDNLGSTLTPTGCPNAGGWGGCLLQPGQFLVSPNQEYELIMQTDGNLVLYYESQADPIWDTGTAGNPGAFFRIQTDGTLIVMSAGNSQSLWGPTASGTPSPTLTLQNDGNLVEYASVSGGSPYAVWSTKTEDLRGYELQPGELLQPGQYLKSQNGEYSLAMSASGYLVLFENGSTTSSSYDCPLWSLPAVVDTGQYTTGKKTTYDPQTLSFSWTQYDTNYAPAPTQSLDSLGYNDGIAPPTGYVPASPTPNAYLAMQTDGNLVLYPQGQAASALWAAGTEANPGAYVEMQNDCNLVVYSSSGAALWESGTNDFRGTALCTDDTLQAGQFLGFSSSTTQASMYLVMQKDCNLVLYEQSGSGSDDAIWSSGTDKGDAPTAGTDSSNPYYGCYVVMQDDGNFVMYAPGQSSAMWSSGTSTGTMEPSTGQPYFGPFVVGLGNPYLLMVRWGVGAAWKVDPSDTISEVSTGANSTSSGGGLSGTAASYAAGKVLTNNVYALGNLFTDFFWL